LIAKVAEEDPVQGIKHANKMLEKSCALGIAGLFSKAVAKGGSIVSMHLG
jgi:hypothetical protein